MSLRPHTTADMEQMQNDPEAHELKYVHDVYNEIADHFSATRYKPWPIISQFLSDLPTGFIGLDSGTGNGKYLPLDQGGQIHIIGVDRSRNLLEHARRAGGQLRDVVLGDALACSWRDGAFDFAMSIATIHHLSTRDRRLQAIETLLRAVSPDHGRILIYVWATQQDENSKRVVPFVNGSQPAQDVFVPWAKSNSKNEPAVVHQRYYHLFSTGELLELVHHAASALNLVIFDGRESSNGARLPRRGVEIRQEGWEKSNWYIELQMWTCDGTP